jgi:hypothetical protein
MNILIMWNKHVAIMEHEHKYCVINLSFCYALPMPIMYLN